MIAVSQKLFGIYFQAVGWAAGFDGVYKIVVFMKKRMMLIGILGFCVLSLTGCWLGAGALGAEGGYIASQEKRSAGQTIDDQVILTALKSKLIGDPDVSGLSINVDVFQGAVTMRGYVKTQKELSRAVELAYATKGVTRVDSRLVLDRP